MDASQRGLILFEPVMEPTAEQRERFISQVPEIVIELKKALGGFSTHQLKLHYRPGKWSIQQIVHHMADNDMNAYIRFKRALTEEEPLAGSYREDLWAELSDYADAPAESSIMLLDMLHTRFHILLRGLLPEAFSRKLRTQVLGSISLDVALQRLIWHNRHHMAQIELFHHG